jgi:hypothetical protein
MAACYFDSLISGVTGHLGLAFSLPVLCLVSVASKLYYAENNVARIVICLVPSSDIYVLAKDPCSHCAVMT